jgi:hypothetical protein
MNSVYRFLAAAFVLAVAVQPAFAGEGGGIAGFPSSTTVDTTIGVGVAAKWNIVSVPLIAAFMHKDSLFPSSISNAFRYDTGYVGDNDLEMGRGYWLKFDSAETVPLFGSAVHKDTFDVVAGWNLFGSVSGPVPVGSITTVPGGITLSKFWQFNAGYTYAAAVEPGRGYWVKASGAGGIVLDAGAAAVPRAEVDPFSGLHTLVIEDSRGMKQTLRFGAVTPKTAGLSTEMPPPPPPGVFDARFEDGSWAELYPAGGERNFAVSVRSAAWPVTVRWAIDAADGSAIELNESVKMTGSGSAVIPGEGPIVIRTGAPALPAAFSLRQNYPNPFNPVTTISYDLPANAAVKLTVYDLLGREVAVLAEGVQEAGTHDVVFDASGYPSGVYFYRIEAGAFSAARKLVLMK